MPLAPGTQVSPNLRLVRKLGQGGMGSVWVAEHLTLRTLVAVEFISPEIAAHPGVTERFNREAVTAAQMKHPHAVQVFDHGVSNDGSLFIAMELLEGESLGDRLQGGARPSLAETCQLVRQTCKALAKAHSLGLVHRDVKPDNIFLTDVDGELFVKVLDFGIARHATAEASATATGATLGTPHYMSPEQAMNAKGVDARADLWSVAVVAYQCVTGRLPFDGETVPAVFVALEKGVFEPPCRFVPGLPAALDVFFGRALARDRSARFATAAELADSFAAAVDAPPAPSAVASAPKQDAQEARTAPSTLLDATVSRAPRASRRRVALLAALGLLAAAAVVVVIAAVRATGSRSAAAPPVADSRAELTGGSVASRPTVPGVVPDAEQPSISASELPVVSEPAPVASRQPPRSTGPRSKGAGERHAPPPGTPPPAPAPPAKGKMPEVGL
jgi:serine/threonine-protein kinase